MFDKKAYMKVWRNKHAEQIRKQRKIWNKRYRLAHPERVKAIAQKYRMAHREEANEMAKKWYIEHPEQRRVQLKKYNQTPKGKEVARKGYCAIKGFGFIPLNKPFPGADQHHIDRERVIFMPAEVHESIPHSVSKNLNMERMNKLAFDFLANQ